MFNVGCGAWVTQLAIIERLEGLLDRRLERRHTPAHAGDVAHTLADVAKAKRLLGYTPLVDFDEGLRCAIEYFKVETRSCSSWKVRVGKRTYPHAQRDY